MDELQRVSVPDRRVDRIRLLCEPSGHYRERGRKRIDQLEPIPELLAHIERMIFTALQACRKTPEGLFACVCNSPQSTALVYTYTLLPRRRRYILDGRNNIDNNGEENAIRPLAIGRLCCDGMMISPTAQFS